LGCSENEKSNPFTESVNAFDLIKVYVAGWFGKPGDAFGRNKEFTPDGIFFKEVMKLYDSNKFGCDDFYAAYKLFCFAKEFSKNKENRGILESKFLFYRVVIKLLLSIMKHAGIETSDYQKITNSLIQLILNKEKFDYLCNNAIGVMKDYFRESDEYSFTKEEHMKKENNKNFYLKNGNLFNDQETDFSKNLYSLVYLNCKNMQKEEYPALKEILLNAEKNKKELQQAQIFEQKNQEKVSKIYDYAIQIPELQKLANGKRDNLLWKDICEYLKIEKVSDKTHQQMLKKWVKENKKSIWPPVPV